MLDKGTTIFLAGHRGTVGAALLRRLQSDGFSNIVLRSREDTDLEDRDAVNRLFAETSPQYVIIAAAKVGGIAANIAAPVDFLLQNLEIQNNLLLACRRHGVRKTVFLGSSCIYPRDAPQPMDEDAFMHGPLEPTNESYAVAKIAGIRLAHALRQQYGTNVILPMPSNVYGPGDHFEFERSHVVSALVRRFCEAVDLGSHTITLWGTGSARRELLHVDDLADAIVFLLARYDDPAIINVGTGEDVTIRELAMLIAHLTGFSGQIEWDISKPNGMPQKLMSVERLHNLGWRHQVSLEDGLRTVIADYRARFPQAVGVGHE